ncbi:MAG: hypothetical protein ACI87W_003083, partial [Halieaceae bacterium]
MSNQEDRGRFRVSRAIGYPCRAKLTRIVPIGPFPAVGKARTYVVHQTEVVDKATQVPVLAPFIAGLMVVLGRV